MKYGIIINYNQTDKKFVFINSDFATNEYRLEYSNVNGEVSNSEWRDNIEQNINPTFGDDFNNNYMNPRYSHESFVYIDNKNHILSPIKFFKNYGILFLCNEFYI